jgi:adenylylsulfate kinase-like enzyme
MTIRKVTVVKNEPVDGLEIEIELRGTNRAGKTVIAALIQETLEHAGFKDITVISADGDIAHARRRLSRIDLRDQRCRNTVIRILDENKPITVKKTLLEKLVTSLTPSR